MISLDGFLLDTEKADLNRNLASRPRQYNDAFGREGELTSGSNGAGRRATTRVTLWRRRSQHQSTVLRKAPLSGPGLVRLECAVLQAALGTVKSHRRYAKLSSDGGSRKPVLCHHASAVVQTGTKQQCPDQALIRRFAAQNCKAIPPNIATMSVITCSRITEARYCVTNAKRYNAIKEA